MSLVGLRPDCLPRDTFGGAEMGVPVLELGLQAKLGEGAAAWGKTARYAGNLTAGIHFMVDDYKFASLVKTPDKILRSGAQDVGELNWSTYHHQPGAEIVHDMYLKRVVSANWQRLGIRIAVDVNVVEEALRWCFLGVPRGWQSYIMRCLSAPGDWAYAQEIAGACQAWAGSNPIRFHVVVEGDKGVAQANERGWVGIAGRNIHVRQTWPKGEPTKRKMRPVFTVPPEQLVLDHTLLATEVFHGAR